MKRGCVAFVLAMIAFCLIMVTLYQCMKWSASPGVLTPRAATAEAAVPTWTRAPFSSNTDMLTPGYNETKWAQEEETIYASSTELAEWWQDKWAQEEETIHASSTGLAEWWQDKLATIAAVKTQIYQKEPTEASP